MTPVPVLFTMASAAWMPCATLDEMLPELVTVEVPPEMAAVRRDGTGIDHIGRRRKDGICARRDYRVGDVGCGGPMPTPFTPPAEIEPALLTVAVVVAWMPLRSPEMERCLH